MRTIVSLALAAMSLTPAPASHAGTGPTKVVGKTYALPKPFDAFEAIPCAGGAEMKAKPIRALLSRLASLEKDLGRGSMEEIYGNTDIAEHAITTESIDEMNRFELSPDLEKGVANAFYQIATKGGYFLPPGVHYNETICAGHLGELDVRWFLHGYLKPHLAKELFMGPYERMKGKGGQDARNQKVNETSYYKGKAMRDAGTLSDFAVDVFQARNEDRSLQAFSTSNACTQRSETKARRCDWFQHRPETAVESIAKINDKLRTLPVLKKHDPVCLYEIKFLAPNAPQYELTVCSNYYAIKGFSNRARKTWRRTIEAVVEDVRWPLLSKPLLGDGYGECYFTKEFKAQCLAPK